MIVFDWSRMRVDDGRQAANRYPRGGRRVFDRYVLLYTADSWYALMGALPQPNPSPLRSEPSSCEAFFSSLPFDPHRGG